uniref:Uncharacterized protein n=1 Tax=Anguilla anguilla TaxID=7936 RepID=A0A0E9TZ46_ANGAN
MAKIAACFIFALFFFYASCVLMAILFNLLVNKQV